MSSLISTAQAEESGRQLGRLLGRMVAERNRAWELVAQLDRENAELRAELAGFRRREIAP